MLSVSATDFGKDVGRYQDAALSQPVIVTRNGRDREVLGVDAFTDADIGAVRSGEPSKEAEAFNRELAQ